jgi:hypothetical protein
MSDDTPTQRFDATGDDAPTQRFSAPGDDAPTQRLQTPATAVPLEVAEERKSRKLIIVLASIGGALLLAVLVILVLLLTRGDAAPGTLPTSSATPTASATATTSPTATPSATPTPTPTPTETVAPPPPPPPSAEVEITAFSGTVQGTPCSSQTQNRVDVLIEWQSENGVAAYFAVGDVDDAETQGMGWTLPPSGNSNDFPNGYVPYEFQCGNASNTYTITVVGTDGDRQSETITVPNTGDVF